MRTTLPRHSGWYSSSRSNACGRHVRAGKSEHARGQACPKHSIACQWGGQRVSGRHMAHYACGAHAQASACAACTGAGPKALATVLRSRKTRCR